MRKNFETTQPEEIDLENKEAEQALAEKDTLPQVDETGSYTDEKGEVWRMAIFLAQDLGISQNKLISFIENYRGEIRNQRGRDKGNRRRTLYCVSDVSILFPLKEFLSLPQVDETGSYVDEKGEKWKTVWFLAQNLGMSWKMASRYLKSVRNQPGRDKVGVKRILYNELDFINLLKESGYFDKKQQSEQEEQVRQKQESLRQLAEEIEQGATIESQEFRELIRLFGGSSIIDIIYAYHPEFKGLPVKEAKKILADYLGDFLIERRLFGLDDLQVNIGKAINFLDNEGLQNALFETIKDSCLTFYREQKKLEPQKDDIEIIQNFLVATEEETYQLKSEQLNQILEKVLEYYSALFEDLKRKKPDNIADSLKEGREFPDVSQLINIKEIADKKRMLIADEMGMGKTASVILAKEYLGLKQALIVAPSNVISTWQNYLSDKKQEGGYFKEGLPPKVLVVEKAEQLEQASRYDYVLISQEKLNDKYTSALMDVNYDMLIVDEVHLLKNIQKGKRAANIIKLAETIKGDSRYLALLSGTPVPNKIKDIAIILKLLYPEEFADMPNNKLVAGIISGDLVDLRSLLVPRMQKKQLAESIEIPDLKEKIVEIELSPMERDIYEILMEEDELRATQKIQILRQSQLNPKILKPTPNIESSKIKTVSEYLWQAFTDKNKIVMFVNNYVENIIRGENNIIEQLGIPVGVAIMIIEGEVNKEQRNEIQKRLRQKSQEKILLLVSGQTAGVGVDFSGADEVLFYNLPWTLYEKDQEKGRVYREGRKTDLISTVFLCNGTIEEGILKYAKEKQRVVEKLLKGIPITEIEKQLLEKSENEEQIWPDMEVNPELAEYYFSAWDRMLKIFAYIKEIGEEDFQKFLSKYGREYASCYADLGNRSYQANGSRVVGSLISSLAKISGQNPENLKIIDIASGPEMLKKHIGDEYQNQVISLDINKEHFRGFGGKRIVGSFVDLPIKDNTCDYTALSFALHYTRFRLASEEYERFAVLTEINRVLKSGGKVVINLIYSYDFADEQKAKQVMEMLGFKIVDEYSGQAIAGKNYGSRVITLEKERDAHGDIKELVKSIDKEALKGLKFKQTDEVLKNSRRIIDRFTLNREVINVEFNQIDKALLEKEKFTITEGERLKERYGGKIVDIDNKEIEKKGWARIYNGSKYVLFKKLGEGEGFVVIK